MRRIQLTQRTARMLRDNLTSNQDGYDYLDLCRLNALAKRLTALQGEYGETIAELIRESKRARRELLRLPNPGDMNDARVNKLTATLTLYQLDEEAEHEAAEGIPADLMVEDGDWKLINDKLSAVTKWVASDSVRELIIAMVGAVKDAESVPDPVPSAFKKD